MYLGVGWSGCQAERIVGNSMEVYIAVRWVDIKIRLPVALEGLGWMEAF